MGVKISELESKSACSPGDLFAIADTDEQETFKLAYEDLREQLRTEITEEDPNAVFRVYTQTYYGLTITVRTYNNAVAHVQVKGTATTLFATNGKWIAIDTSGMGVIPAEKVSGYTWINALQFTKYEWTTQGVLRIGLTRNGDGSDQVIQRGYTVEFNFSFLLG